MASQKSADKATTAATGSKAQKQANKPTAPSSTIRQDHIEKFTLKSEFWDSFLDVIPPWFGEVVGFTLVVFGILSLLSVLNVTSDATVSIAWSNALTTAFGYGALVISIGIFLFGVYILLREFGVKIGFATSRVLALEIAFLALLALVHLVVGGNGELRTLVRSGEGGGAVGWALSSVIANLFGMNVALAFYGLIFILSIVVVSGVRRDQLAGWLTNTHGVLNDFATRTRTRIAELRAARQEREAIAIAARAEAAKPMPPAETIAAPRPTAQTILRIRPDPDSLPPSLRPGAQPLEPMPEVVEKNEDYSQHPLFMKHEANPALAEQIGVIQGKRVKGQPVMVQRPDGRIKRFYTVEGMKETKFVAKRDPTLPPLSLLRDSELLLPEESEINNNVVLIENTLLEFDIDIDVVDVKVGPTVTQYAVQPFREGKEGESAQGRTRISKIASLQSDLALSLSARRLRMETPVPGHSYIGIEVPNKKPSVVALRSVYESKTYQDQAAKKKSPLFIPLGRDVSGAPVGVDLSQMPHLLIAGTTGSGKSVCIAAMAASLVLDNMPDTVKLIMLDPKMVELSRYNGLPHLLGPVETDQERIIGVLRWCTREMDRRYKLLEENAARNIDIFNSRLGRRRKDEYLPYIVILIDEIGDLMMSKPEETEKTITRLAQMARAVGMHLVVATQRPSVDVITGLIKANFPSRISFAVASGVDSRVILDTVGAEALMGRGDMLYQPADSPFPRRLQGCYVSDDEVRGIVEHWRVWQEKQVAAGRMDAITIGPWERGLTRREFLSETDPMLEQAIALVIEAGEASASHIQRQLGVGYPRAARIMDLLEELGVVGEVKGGGRNREVLIRPGRDPFKDIIDKKLNKK
ncbi:MAG: DNA translocase FtsK [Chloroflexota bacterium]|nr:DNA translocase FtsK [Chloroflexota bacterium]